MKDILSFLACIFLGGNQEEEMIPLSLQKGITTPSLLFIQEPCSETGRTLIQLC